jgi:hypothetical protein
MLKSSEADKTGQWKAFWNLLGFTQWMKAKVDFSLSRFRRKWKIG